MMIFQKRRFLRDAASLAEGEISVDEFLQKHASQPLYYSTPFGEDAGGKQQLWVLSSRDCETKYMPAFTDKEKCRTFFTMIGRRDFIIIKGDLAAFLNAFDSHPILRELGAVVDPDSSAPIEFPPMTRVNK